MEHGGVGRVNLVLAVNAPRGNHAYGQRVRLHRAYLHGRGLRAQQHAVILRQVEGVAPLAGRMVLRRVELCEVIFGKLYLRSLEYFKAHADKNVLYLVENVIHGVLVADRGLAARHGDIHGLALEPALKEAGLNVAAALVQPLLKLGADLVCKLAHDGALLRGELAHLLENGGQLALLAEIPDAQGLKLLRLLSLRDGAERFFTQCLQHFLHSVSPY